MTDMARTSIFTGIALIIVGVGVTLLSDSKSVTSLIPAFIGAVFVLLGAIGAAKPSLNHHVMHGAAALSLLAIIASLGSLIARGSTGWALASQLATVAICAVFLFLAIGSFRAARASRAA